MSPECDFEALDALVAGELGPAQALEVRAHAAGCARCAHELSWLASERELFSQRAACASAGPQATALAALAPFGAPSRASAPRARKTRLGLYAAAACLLIVGLSPQLGRAPENPGALAPSSAPRDEAVYASVDPQWAIASLERQVGACLLATPSVGLVCGAAPEIPASFGLAGD